MGIVVWPPSTGVEHVATFGALPAAAPHGTLRYVDAMGALVRYVAHAGNDAVGLWLPEPWAGRARGVIRNAANEALSLDLAEQTWAQAKAQNGWVENNNDPNGYIVDSGQGYIELSQTLSSSGWCIISWPWGAIPQRYLVAALVECVQMGSIGRPSALYLEHYEGSVSRKLSWNCTWRGRYGTAIADDVNVADTQVRAGATALASAGPVWRFAVVDQVDDVAHIYHSDGPPCAAAPIPWGSNAFVSDFWNIGTIDDPGAIVRIYRVMGLDLG